MDYEGAAESVAMTSPRSFDFSIQQGEDFDAVLIWRDSGEPVDLTGMSATLSIIRAFSSESILEMTTDNGRITLGGTMGTIVLHIDAADTELLTFDSAIYNLYAIDGETTYWLLHGRVILYRAQYVDEDSPTPRRAEWGDTIYSNGTSWVKLAAGSPGQVLRTSGPGANPEWAWDTLYNRSSADQGPGFAVDTYLIGSGIEIPDNSLKAGTLYRCTFRLTKTAAGTDSATLRVRVGPNGDVTDAERCIFTFTSGTPAVDDGMFQIFATFDSVGSGSSAVLRGTARCTHRLSTRGITGTSAVSETEHSVSAGFDSTGAGNIIGVSVDGGAASEWTIQHVMAELENFA